MQRAVNRGLARSAAPSPAHICVDETSFRKRHNYVTIVSDPKTGKVLNVSEGRTKSSLRAWYAGLTPAQLEQIESVSMDMWPAYIQSTLACVPGAKRTGR
ncbi:MAG: transposase [Bacteroidetes bacterium]|nr:transposase [Bacteroidota bacterium]